MAKFEDVLPAFREGKKIKRKTSSIQIQRSETETAYFTINGLLADDWEIVEEKPLPCPFCGGGNIRVEQYYHPGEKWIIYCTTCCGEGPRSYKKEEAISLWNKAKR